MRTRALFTAAVVVGTLVLAGCSGDGTAAQHTPSRTAPATGLAASPTVVAASAVGTRSRTDVTALHAMGASTTTDDRVPHAELPKQGTAIGTSLREQVRDATRLPPPPGSAAARLASALGAYAALADQLADWDPSGPRLGTGWFDRLASTDKTWRQAMQELSKLTGRNLLAGLPTFARPTS